MRLSEIFHATSDNIKRLLKRAEVDRRYIATTVETICSDCAYMRE
jgi:hypothetical protein